MIISLVTAIRVANGLTQRQLAQLIGTMSAFGVSLANDWRILGMSAVRIKKTGAHNQTGTYPAKSPTFHAAANRPKLKLAPMAHSKRKWCCEKVNLEHNDSRQAKVKRLIFCLSASTPVAGFRRQRRRN
jgi:hypothetical protein